MSRFLSQHSNHMKLKSEEQMESQVENRNVKTNRLGNNESECESRRPEET